MTQPSGQLLFWQQRRLVIGVIGLLIIMAIPVRVLASGQGFYVLNGTAQNGMLMSLTANPNAATPANNSNAKSLVGVVAPNDSNFGEQQGQTNIQTDGEAQVLVSTLDGNIKAGDRITTSPLDGVGAKDTASGWTVGTAQASLNGQTHGAVRTTITDAHGKRHSVLVASIPLAINISYYSTTADSSQNTVVPSALQQVADSLAGKHVSILALILSFLLFLVAFILAGSIIMSAVWGSFAAISRQPTALFAIRRHEARSFVIAAAIFIVGSVAAWMLLKTV